MPANNSITLIFSLSYLPIMFIVSSISSQKKYVRNNIITIRLIAFTIFFNSSLSYLKDTLDVVCHTKDAHLTLSRYIRHPKPAYKMILMIYTLSLQFYGVYSFYITSIFSSLPALMQDSIFLIRRMLSMHQLHHLVLFLLIQSLQHILFPSPAQSSTIH